MTITVDARATHRRAALGVAGALALFGAVSVIQAARADDSEGPRDPRYLLLPSIPGWFDGKIALYASTDTSDQGAATANKLNYAPSLANAANTGAVDDIYTVTNFSQSNVVPSAPQPAGPKNTNKAYSPLWQLSQVTWASGTTPHTLTSEKAILDAKAKGLVTIVKTNVVINCPIIYTPSGGTLPGAHVIDIGR